MLRDRAARKSQTSPWRAVRPPLIAVRTRMPVSSIAMAAHWARPIRSRYTTPAIDAVMTGTVAFTTLAVAAGTDTSP